MVTIPLDGKHLRVWSREDMRDVVVLDPAGSGDNRAADQDTVDIPSPCHCKSAMTAVYLRPFDLVLLRCWLCGAVVRGWKVAREAKDPELPADVDAVRGELQALVGRAVDLGLRSDATSIRALSRAAELLQFLKNRFGLPPAT